MEQNLENIRKQFNDELSSVETNIQQEQLSLKYFGRKGIINQLLSDLKNQPREKIKSLGKEINNLKKDIEQLITQKSSTLKQNPTDKIIDPTLPGKQYPIGSIHIVSTAIEEITGIFAKIGFIRMSYPEVEWEWGAFESLNIPVNHPARDDVETSFLDVAADPKLGKMVLTPHTSNGQNREMKRTKPPIRMINISKCYRPNWDATHSPMFYQFEGFCIDQYINITNLKGTLDYFAQKYFGDNIKTRLRPHHFQFTEPSFEVDITCTVCQGTGLLIKNFSEDRVGVATGGGPKKGASASRRRALFGTRERQNLPDHNSDLKQIRCKICKSGWLELGGTGMIHPNVLTMGGINPDQFSGWAFGFGIERVIMMKYMIDDIRNYYSGDIRFLEQF